MRSLDFRSGDKIRVHYKIKEGDKVRVQPFEGLVIAIGGQDAQSKSFTVRQIASGEIGVERIFPLQSPNIEKVEILERGNVRRAKLYYLRDRVGKAALKVKKAPKKSDERKKPKPKPRSSGGKAGGKVAAKK
jgi:large subunit ribosomal protein L19